MLSVISPAKAMDMSKVDIAQTTTPEFMAQASELVDVARDLSAADLKALMGISDQLIQLNMERFQAFSSAPTAEAVKPAIFAFNGDTYQGFDAKSLDEDALRWGQDNLRILSGLYGVLRPLDLMQPYRLEMGIKLKTARGASLYEFWGDTIAKALNAQAEVVGTSYVLNCASQEYFKSVKRKALDLQVITPTFLEDKGGKPPRIISFYAKKARGAMARFVAENRITDPQDLQGFEVGGYAYSAERSEQLVPVFIRHHA